MHKFKELNMLLRICFIVVVVYFGSFFNESISFFGGSGLLYSSMGLYLAHNCSPNAWSMHEYLNELEFACTEDVDDFPLFM